MVSIPYALMKANPLSWIQKVCAYKGNGSSTISRFILHSRSLFDFIFGD